MWHIVWVQRCALAVDTVLIIGAYSLCYGWVPFSLEIDQTFIGAILTAIGYSINDKVVIFDRIREFFGCIRNVTVCSCLMIH